MAGVWGTVQAALKYFVLDCRCRLCQDVLLALAFSMRMTPSRSRAEFSNGRLPTAMLMDVDAFRCLRLPRLDSPAAAPPTAAVSLSLALSRIPFVCFFFPQSRRSTRRPQGRSRVHAACARHCAGCDAPSNCRLPERRASTPAHLYLPFYPCLPLPSLLPLPTSTFPSTSAPAQERVAAFLCTHPLLTLCLPELRDQHIAIMGRGHDDADAASIVTMLLAKGMPHVGLINGGYAEVLRLAELRLVELADFVPQTDPEAESGSKHYLSSPLRQVSSALGDVGSNVSSTLGSVTSKLESIGFAAADKAQVRGKAALDAVAADTQQFADKAHVKAKAALGAVAADTQQLKAVAQSKAASAFGFLGAAIGSIKQQFLEEPAPAAVPKAAASKVGAAPAALSFCGYGRLLAAPERSHAAAAAGHPH